MKRRHVPGAINLSRGEINDRILARWPIDTLFVVYCGGPHCNGADKAALAAKTELGHAALLIN
jgi:rhodanese-related sulfurtransferase